MAMGVQPVWAGHEFRLDPAKLPQKLSYATSSAGGEVTITIDHRGAVLKRVLENSRLPINMALPARAFQGVAARAMETGPESAIVTLELLHTDPDLCIPLRVGQELTEIAKDWHSWSQLLGLPMLLVDADGVTRDLNASAEAIMTEKAYDRRPHAMFTERRPRFLARRRMGQLGCRLVVDGDEIIARN